MPASRASRAARGAAGSPAAAEQQIEGFVAKFDPSHQALIRAVRRAMRRRMPAANELVYDSYNFFVIAYCTTERPSDCVLSITAGAGGIGVCFMRGATLPDPKQVLLGSGNQTRFIRVPSADALARPEIEALVAAAIEHAKTPLPASGRGKLIIRSISAKQRPRRRSRASA